MTLYHSTKKENQGLIEISGTPVLSPGNQENLSWSNADVTLQGTDICGIFGFLDIEDAKDFGYENGGEFVVYSFEAEGEVIDDPEYKDDPDFLRSDAKFFITENFVNATVEFDVED